MTDCKFPMSYDEYTVSVNKRLREEFSKLGVDYDTTLPELPDVKTDEVTELPKMDVPSVIFIEEMSSALGSASSSVSETAALLKFMRKKGCIDLWGPILGHLAYEMIHGQFRVPMLKGGGKQSEHYHGLSLDTILGVFVSVSMEFDAALQVAVEQLCKEFGVSVTDKKPRVT